MKQSTIFLVCLLGLIACERDAAPGLAAEQSASISQVLVDTSWIEQNLSNPIVRILDLGKTRDEFLQAHIPGAQFVDWRVNISDPAVPEHFNIAPQDMMEVLLGRLGITPETTIVLYDNRNSRLAARMFWSLRYYDHEDVRILNGGVAVWEAAGHQLTSEVESKSTTAYEITGINEDYRADKAFIQSRLGDNGFTLVDGRSKEQYTGEAHGTVFGTGIEHQKTGHIYGAQNIVWNDNFNPDGSFKSVDELRELYESHGVIPGKTVVTYCNVGIQSSAPWFVLKELLGYEDVRLYDSSMAEWANTQDTNMVIGEHCMGK